MFTLKSSLLRRAFFVCVGDRPHKRLHRHVYMDFSASLHLRGFTSIVNRTQPLNMLFAYQLTCAMDKRF